MKNDIERAIKYIEFIQCENNDLSINTKLIAIKEILEKQLNGGWISVKEKLPESEDNLVLAQFNNGSIETVHIQDYFDDITAGLDENGNQLYTKWYISQGVVAWQPLPPAWKGENNG